MSRAPRVAAPRWAWLSALGAVAALAPGCAKLECGVGTREIDGVCIPGYDEVVCGPGTVEVDGECVVEDDGAGCGPGTVRRGDACVAAELQFVHLPFEAGRAVEITQGYLGYYSHNGSSLHAVDFPCAEGTTIVAARAGRVRSIREDSDTGCADPSCADDGNYVIVDHGDGTFGLYWHLEFHGALVEPDDVVARGQPIARSGNTGWSSGPHLHFAVEDLFGWSLPLYLEEYGELSYGTPFAGATVLSANDEQPLDGEPQFSACPPDAFLHMGIWLDTDVPCSVAIRGESYPLAGWSAADAGNAVVARHVGPDAGWDYACAEGDAGGEFGGQLSWEPQTFGSSSYLMIAAADEECATHQGWDASVPIALW